MSNYRKHIDNFFKEKLGRYRETPPPEVWDDLEARLDTLVPQAPGSYRWLKHFGMVSLIVILSVSLVRKITGNSSSDGINLNEKVLAKVEGAAPATGNKTEASNANDATAKNDADNTQDNIAATNTGALTAVDQLDKNVPSGNARRYNGNAISKSHTSASKNKVSGKLYKEQEQAENDNQLVVSKPGPRADISENSQSAGVNNTSSSKKDPTPKLPGSLKTENTGKAINTSAQKQKSQRFEIGLKAGYERGFNDFDASKYVISPYIQYNLSSKIAVMTQPSIKSASMQNKQFGKTSSYYKANNDATQTGESTANPIFEGGSIVGYTYSTNYTYSQTHDSIVKSYTIGGSYMEYELPVLLKYAITSNVSFYGGANFAYSRASAITEHTYTSKGILKSVNQELDNQSSADPLPVGNVITYSGNPYSDYKGPQYTTTASSLRLGYMVGFSYEYSHRWLFDALMQQTPVKADVQNGYSTNSSLAIPYFRMTIGYKLTH